MAYKKRNQSIFEENKIIIRIVCFFALIGFINFFNTLNFQQKVFFYVVYGIVILYMLREIFIIDKKVKKLEAETIVDLSDQYTVIQKLREIDPKEFEDIIGVFFEMRGYTIIQQAPREKVRGKWKALPDKGIDLIVTKNGNTKYIQIKKLITHQVGSGIVRDFYGTVGDKINKGDEGIILTTSIFSQDSRKFAQEKGIKMIDYMGILKEIDYLGKQYKREIENHLNNITTKNNLKFKKYAKTCRKCYAPLVKRRGNFYGCMNYHFTGCDYCEQ